MVAGFFFGVNRDGLEEALACGSAQSPDILCEIDIDRLTALNRKSGMPQGNTDRPIPLTVVPDRLRMVGAGTRSVLLARR